MGWSESISLTRRIFTVADPKPPVDPCILRARLAVDELPAHVRRRRHPVDLDHVVFPLDPLGRLMAVLVAVAVVTMSLMVAVLGSPMLFFLLTVALAVPRVAVVFLVRVRGDLRVRRGRGVMLVAG